MRVRLHVGSYHGSDSATKIVDSEHDDKNFDNNKIWPATKANPGFQVFSATPGVAVENIKDIIHDNMKRRYRGSK